jgi:hypothetical protein
MWIRNFLLLSRLAAVQGRASLIEVALLDPVVVSTTYDSVLLVLVIPLFSVSFADDERHSWMPLLLTWLLEQSRAHCSRECKSEWRQSEWLGLNAAQ